jgi:hypothetical protein
VKKTVTDMPIKKEKNEIGNGGELHQRAGGTHPQLTTQLGQPISDDENSLKASDISRPGPVLLEESFFGKRSIILTTSVFRNALSTRAARQPTASLNLRTP